MPSAPEIPRCSKAKLWVLAAAIPLLLVGALAGRWVYSRSDFDASLAALRAGGLPTVAREVNDLYSVPSGVTDSTALWIAAIQGLQNARSKADGTKLPIVGSSESPVLLPGEAWPDLDGSRNYLAALSPEMQAIRRAAAAGGQVRFPVDFSAGVNTLLTNSQEMRSVTRLLSLDAYVSAHDRNSARVLEDIVALFALSDALRGEPTLISQLIRISNYGVACDTAVRLMPSCAWSDADLQTLLAAVRSAGFRDELRHALVGERALCLSAVDGMPLGPLKQANSREVLRFFDRAIESYSGSWTDILARQRELAGEIAALQSTHIASMQLKGFLESIPAIEAAARGGARAEARQRCMTAVIAIWRYRLQHNRLPATLAEVESLLPRASDGTPVDLADPFDGQPLHFKVEDQRIVIYSVGDNQADDGGDVSQDDRPAGQPNHPPLDVGFAIDLRPAP